MERVRVLGLHDWARVSRLDAFQVYQKFDAVDYLHVDISNGGDVIRWTFGQWAKKVKQAILFEGGSPARDRVA